MHVLTLSVREGRAFTGNRGELDEITRMTSLHLLVEILSTARPPQADSID